MSTPPPPHRSPADAPSVLAVVLAVARSAWPVWLIALLIVGTAELAARSVLGDDATWIYWNRTMASKVRYLGKQSKRGLEFPVYILGDSSAAFNIMPSVLDPVTEQRSFNLGSAGNYARSFDLVMRQHVLQQVPDPELMVVSFAGRGFLPESAGQTQRVLSSPIGQKLQGNRVWGEHLWLVRIHHLLRLYRDPPVAPTVFRNRGFEPYLKALQRRPRRPRMANRLPKPPSWLIRPSPPSPVGDEGNDPLAPLERLFAHAAERDIQVVIVSPPADERTFVDEIAALCAQHSIPHLDYTDAPLPSHNSHLSVQGARAYSRKLGEDLLALQARDYRP